MLCVHNLDPPPHRVYNLDPGRRYSLLKLPGQMETKYFSDSQIEKFENIFQVRGRVCDCWSVGVCVGTTESLVWAIQSSVYHPPLQRFDINMDGRITAKQLSRALRLMNIEASTKVRSSTSSANFHWAQTIFSCTAVCQVST